MCVENEIVRRMQPFEVLLKEHNDMENSHEALECGPLNHSTAIYYSTKAETEVGKDIKI